MAWVGWVVAGVFALGCLVLWHLNESPRIAANRARLAVEQEALDRVKTELEEAAEHDRAARISVEAELEAKWAELRDAKRQVSAEVERVAGLSAQEAKAEIVTRISNQAKLEGLKKAREIERRYKTEAQREARRIVVTAIQRIAADQTSEVVVSTVTLASDDLKGRVIGREGRNIRSFEQITGATLYVDETPNTVLLSCFDPERREIARLTLEALLADGVIHPARIEMQYEKAKRRYEGVVLQAGRDALTELGIVEIAPELVPILGSLRFRTSYGQNVLDHLVECGRLAGLMAAELGLDVAHCTRAAFLHDIGKAITHEQGESHALAGAELLRKYGENEDICHAVAAHHNEVEPQTVEALLTQAADAISGSRPGARRESLENYVERMEMLEQIARSHEGVDNVFAVQAGREIRVMVHPEKIDDDQARELAEKIAGEIGQRLTLSGRVRVTVVRESRAIAYAR